MPILFLYLSRIDYPSLDILLQVVLKPDEVISLTFQIIRAHGYCFESNWLLVPWKHIIA